jgi:hypothetical protein
MQPPEQRKPELAFRMQQDLVERRLRRVQHLGRRRQRAAPHDGPENLDLACVHCRI